MIAAGDLQDFVPFGRDYYEQHPKGFQQQVQRTPPVPCRSDLGVQLVTALKGVSLKDKQQSYKEKWLIRADPTSSDNHYEEELYSFDKSVIWSKGNICKNRVVYKTFTVDYPVQQALWCDIYAARNKPELISDPQNEDGQSVACVCVVDSANLNFFTVKGQEYVTALCFQVVQVWPMKYGLILERAVLSHELNSCKSESEQLATVFSLLHPLDEITPVIRSGNPKLSYMNEQEIQIIYTSVDPSLLMMYNRKTGVHSIWKIRRARPDELVSLRIMNDSVSTQPLSTPTQSLSSSYKSWRYLTPIRNLSNRSQSPAHSRPQSPSLTQMAALSRSHSPSLSANGSYHVYPYTPSSNTRSKNSHLTDSTVGEPPVEKIQPLGSDICLDPIWSEPPNFSKNAAYGNASKAFITKDFVDQQFFCFVVPLEFHLRAVKFEESNDQSQIIFGAMTTISARDAVPLQDCNTMLVLEVGYTLTLYSGIIKVCKVYIPSMPSSLSNFETPYRYPLASSRRNSLIVANNSLTAMDDVVQFVSPVRPICDNSQLDLSYVDEPSCSTSITKLHDPVYNRITVETIHNTLQRVTIPKLVESSLVDICLESVRSVLPRDLAVQLYTKWYSAVNTLGNSRDNRSHEWSVFVACLLGLMGYNLEQLAVAKQLEINLSLSPGEVAKKFKSGDAGSEEDWQFLLSTNHHEQNSSVLENLFDLPKISGGDSKLSTSGAVNCGALLFPHIPAVLYALHIVYEELKLQIKSWSDLESLVPLLIQLARDLRVQAFVDYYWRDFPHLYVCDEQTQIQESVLADMIYPPFLTPEPPNVFQWVHKSLLRLNTEPFPYISNVNTTTKTIITLFAAIKYGNKFNLTSSDEYLKKIIVAGCRPQSTNCGDVNFSLSNRSSVHEMIVDLMTQMGLMLKDLENLPIGVALPLRNAIFQCRRNPPASWSEETYSLIGRQDLLVQMKSNRLQKKEKRRKADKESKRISLVKEDDDGMENMDQEILKMRFPNDQRVHEVRRLLQSSKPVRVYIAQRPEVSDHDFVEEQERYLYGMCMRTMALPVGRGMFTLHTSQPVVTETLPIPKLCLTGRAPPRNTTVDLTHIDPPTNMNTWPLFHNGVAAGLRISPYASQIDSTWIVFNKPKGSTEMPMEHAGFLMSLGLNGHLNNLAILNTHDYLTKGHEMTNVGLILGIAAAKRGTMDAATTKLLSIHVEALLPPTSTELDVPHVVQVAAILGVGLVYEGTNHRHMSELLLAEIGRPPGPEMENSNDRESYSLAAGLALGLVTFGAGNDASALLDLSMADQLYHYMVGGYKRSLFGLHKEKFKSPSYQIKEGDSVNIDVTSPGATLALAMMYFRTGNKAVASWMNVPDTQFLLDFVRPDFLLLRTFGKGLILWDEVIPSSKWVESHIPYLVASKAFKKNKDDNSIDYETMNQAYCNIVAGACLALGFRFAGSANNDAYNTLTKYVKMFISVTCKHTGEPARRSTLENCLNVSVLSLAMVMAGTGDLDVLRICRFMHFRLGQSNNFILYGSHLATHMALGLLFLGGGKYTLSTQPFAVAAMICAFFPKFPIHSSDNRYHLQAFRHLYVLAIEPRLVVPRDIDTNLVSYTDLNIKFKDSNWYENSTYKIRAPCFLPDLNTLEEVSVDDPRYWPIKFHNENNWKSLKSLLTNDGTLFVKQKAGYMSYVEDPRGFRSILTQSLTKDNVGNWSIKTEAIEAFTSDPKVLNFTKCFLQQETNGTEDGHLKQLLCSVLFECVTQEKLEFFPTCVSLIKILRDFESSTSSINDLWQIKLALTFCNSLVKQNGFNASCGDLLLNPEFAFALKSRLETCLRTWRRDNLNVISNYLTSHSMPKDYYLTHFLIYFDVLTTQKYNEFKCFDSNLAVLSLQLKNLNLSTSTLINLIEK